MECTRNFAISSFSSEIAVASGHQWVGSLNLYQKTFFWKLICAIRHVLLFNQKLHNLTLLIGNSSSTQMSVPYCNFLPKYGVLTVSYRANYHRVTFFSIKTDKYYFQLQMTPSQYHTFLKMHLMILLKFLFWLEA